jgi:HEAT repeat protein
MFGRTNGLEVIEANLRSREMWRRFVAAVALAQWDAPRAREMLKGRLEDRTPAIRRLAEGAGKGQASGALVEALHDGDSDIRQYAARALLFFKDPSTIPALRHACTDLDPEVRAAARLSLRRIERFQNL